MDINDNRYLELASFDMPFSICPLLGGDFCHANERKTREPTFRVCSLSRVIRDGQAEGAERVIC